MTTPKPQFFTRQQIGLRPPNPHRMANRSAAELAHLLGITWHDTGAGGKLYNVDPFARLRGIQAFHMDVLGYGDIAYEGGFDDAGRVFFLRDETYVGAHAESSGNVANRLTNGVVFLEDRDGLTPGAAVGFKACADLFTLAYHRPAAGFDHNYWRNHGGKPTQCSGPLRPLVRLLGGSM